jgi:hypothetical protein
MTPLNTTDATNTAHAAAREIVFVDSRVQDSAELLQGLSPGAEVVYLRAGADGLQQMAAALGSRGDVGAVHILAHGSAGQLWLGSTFLDQNTLASHADALAAIGRGLTPHGDLLVYACDLASGNVGAQFVARLADLTGAVVAASNNRTGAGGDWALEVSTGHIDAASVLSQAATQHYNHSLATLTVTTGLDSGQDAAIGASLAADTADGGGLSLREALHWAAAGDTITFNAGMTVSLNSQLTISKNLTIEGDLNHDGIADVTLDGQYKDRVVDVTAGNVTLDGLVITKGLAAGPGGAAGTDAGAALGGGIYNMANLTLKNVTVTANAASGGGGGGGVTAPYVGGAVGGGGGGGGGIGGQAGGRGGNAGFATGVYAGNPGTAGKGGNGGSYNVNYMGGKGGGATGGAGGLGAANYSNGGAGGTASNGTISIGGGGGGSGWDQTGGAGAVAAGGIYNASGGTLTIVGTSVISNNLGAGGGGGGGGGLGGSASSGGAGGLGVGAIWNKGAILITAANYAAITGNAGGSGNGGPTLGGGGTGASPTKVNGIFNDGGTLNTNYVPDTTPPTSAIVVATTSLNSSSTSLVTITFSEAVQGFSNTDLTIANGTLSAVSSSDGGITWTATLTAKDNVSSASNAITLDNTGVSDLAGNAGVGTTTSNNYVIHDTLPPTATVVVANGALNVGAASLVTITFSEAVTGFSNAALAVANGTLSAVSSSDGGVTWTATLTPTNNITSNTNLITLDKTGVHDLSGNAGVGTTSSNNYAIDTQRPTATVAVANAALSIGQTSPVTITFSEKIAGFTNADLSITNGTLGAVSSSDGGITWTATFTPTAGITSASNLISLDNSGVSDLAGNAGAGTTNSNNYAIDTQRPTASIALADSTLTAGKTSLVTVTFSEAVSGFTNADLSVPHGTLSAVSSSDGGITWTATYTPTAGIASPTNLISLNNSGVADLAGNAGTGITNSANFTIDTVRPTATIVVADSALKVGDSSLVTITFSEAVAGFSNADLTVANGTLSAVSSSDGGITWTTTLTPSNNITDSTNLITLDNSGVHNASGNAGVGSTDSNNYAIDTQRPTATIAVTHSTLEIGDTSPVTITFSEAVTGFDNADLHIDNGTLSAVTSSDGGKTWTATLTPAAGIDSVHNLITLSNGGVIDLAGNTGSGTTSSNNYVLNGVDHTPPPIPVPSDNDNVPDAVENLVPGLTPFVGSPPMTGDGNGDGILDSKQADVASLPLLNTPTAQSNPSGAAPVYVTLVAGSVEGKIIATNFHAMLNNVHQLDAPLNLPAEIKMPLGLIAFTATVQNPGATENFSLYVDPALPVNGYWKINAAGTWVNLASAAYGGNTVLEGGKLRLDFHITDGGEFDADGKADGIITDPGAAGFMPLSIVGYKPELPAGGHFWF